MDLMLKNVDLSRKDIKQINDMQERQKKTAEKSHALRKSGVTKREERGGSRLSLAR